MASRLRSTSIALSSSFLLLAAAGCDSQEPDTAQVCMERETQTRAPENQCPPDETGVTSTAHTHVWVWQKGYVPAVGSKLTGFSTVKTGIVGTAPAGGGYASDGGGISSGS